MLLALTMITNLPVLASTFSEKVLTRVQQAADSGRGLNLAATSDSKEIQRVDVIESQHKRHHAPKLFWYSIDRTSRFTHQHPAEPVESTDIFETQETIGKMWSKFKENSEISRRKLQERFPDKDLQQVREDLFGIEKEYLRNREQALKEIRQLKMVDADREIIGEAERREEALWREFEKFSDDVMLAYTMDPRDVLANQRVRILTKGTAIDVRLGDLLSNDSHSTAGITIQMGRHLESKLFHEELAQTVEELDKLNTQLSISEKSEFASVNAQSDRLAKRARLVGRKVIALRNHISKEGL